ncbi:MAG: S41 family peptidase [Gemmatimonadota bacterium]
MLPSLRRASAVLRLLVLSTLLCAVPAAAQTKLLRFPDIHGDQVVFTYAGDLWTASSEGGTAVRLTAHPGLELFAKYSPDGKWIAFTGQYDGDEQVYVIPSTGGVPRQLTFYPARGPLPPRWGYDNQVYGWTPDGKEVVFRSLRDGWDLGDTHLYHVPVSGGLPVAYPMPQSGAGDLSPDGTKVVYSPLFRDFRAWKRYSGGWAEDLWTFDLSTHEAHNITNNVRTDRDPMWIGDRIYFDSDRSDKLNLYSVKPDGTDLQQLTDETTWDVRWPSADETGHIVYELGGELHVLDASSGADRKLDIFVPDDQIAARPRHESVAGYIEDASLSPDGKRAVFVARGDVFTAPAEYGPTRNLTHSSSAHDKGARWSPDGRKIAFISDMSGEEELYLIDQDGSGEPERLTTDGDMMRYTPVWSPDSKRLAFSDKLGRLWSLTVADKRLTQVARDSTGNVGDQTWSPDGRWLTFSLTHRSGFRAVYVWDAQGGALHQVTDSLSNSYEPVFGAEGKYLFFLSDREYAPQVSTMEWDYATARTTGIFALALRKDVPAPFPPRSDEADVEGADSAAAGGEAKPGGAGGGPTPVAIDFDGLADRIARVPVTPDNYSGLSAVKGNLLYMKSGPFFYGRSSGVQPDLMIFNLESRKATTLAEGAFGYSVSPDGTKLLVRQNGAFKLYDPRPGASSSQTVSTAGLQADIDPKQEWAEIFDEVWRRFRDFFYVPNMNGYDWKAIRDRYEPLLKYVGHRSDLDYVLNEMIAELSNSHTYISGGDYEIPDRPEVALPGARFALDASAGRYRIAKIFAGDNAESAYRSPLTEIGVDAHVGDYVLAIDGRELTASDNPYALLQHKGDHPVTLTLNDHPSTDGAREVSYEPIASETKLVYLGWVAGNREKVDEMTDGRVGYLHVPDMGADGISEFIKWYYPQIRKEGLIIDVRGNGGGNVSSMLIERLSRTLLAAGYSRNNDYPSTYPRGPVFYGSLVSLLNETSASDGDIFPAMFKQAGLGPLIGKRSWGGVTGITSHGPLIDGGTVNVPEFGFISVDGRWIIEGHGVEPDIEVENDPQSVLEGRDPQLERGVQEILRLIRENPKHLPTRPAPPVRAPGGGGGR